MKNLWIWFMPLLFLPNLGVDNATKYGALKLTDYLIWPYGLLLLFGMYKSEVRFDPQLNKYGKYFMGWAGLGVLLVLVYYHEYRRPMQIFSFISLKYFKFALYALSGWFTARALSDRESVAKFHWSFLVCILITGISCLIGFRERNDFVTGVYEAANQISVILAMLLAYLIALLTSDYGSPWWRKSAIFTALVGLAGISVTGGRGGWIALIVGITYILFKQKINIRTIGYFLVAPVALIYFYETNERFRKDWDRIFFPEQGVIKEDLVAGFDDGARWGHLKNEAPKVLDAPFFGTGFFHRGGWTSLWKTGSHNFFMQMILETGLVGGYLLYNFLKRLWKTAGRSVVRYAKLTLAYRAMFIVAVLGGCSGEYYYGGRALLCFMLMYAPIGAVLSMGMYRDHRGPEPA